MIKDCTWLIILVIFGLLIFYSNSSKNINMNMNRIDDYKVVRNFTHNNNDLESYKNKQRETDVKVYVREGEYPFQINDNNNDYEFGVHSIYEIGRININPSY
jgi:hypothetical protein